jgi:hypothetical protein
LTIEKLLAKRKRQMGDAFTMKKLMDENEDGRGE